MSANEVPHVVPNVSAAAAPQEPSKKLVIAICGGLNWDMITVASQLPSSGETLNAKSFVEMPGGKGANAAIALHRQSHVKPASTPTAAPRTENAGQQIKTPPRNAFEEAGLPEIEVRMVGSIGMHESDERRGVKMKESLQRNWVNVDHVREQADLRSAVALTTVEADSGENRILVYPGANHTPTPQDFEHIDSLGIPKPDLVVAQLEMNRETVGQILRIARDAGIETLLNPSPGHYLDEEIYEGLTHLVLNETEAAIMTGRPSDALDHGFDDWSSITDHFLDLGVKNVVVTLGDKGAFFTAERGRGFAIPAVAVPPKNVLDTSGAGDTFVGAYATQWLKQKHLGGRWDAEATVAYANRAASMIIQRVGCQEAIPWASDFEPPKAVESRSRDETTQFEAVHFPRPLSAGGPRNSW